MSLWLQNLLVLCLVAACVVAVGRQLVGTFRLKKGAKLGICCTKGCEAMQSDTANSTVRTVFIPADSLVRRRS